MKSILILSKPTCGDIEYFKRWERVAPIDIEIPNKDEDVFVIVTDQYTPITGEHIKRYPNLEYVISPTTGETHLSNYELMNSGVKILTLKEEHEFLKTITSVAEHTIYLLFQLAKTVANPSLKLAGKKMAVIGTGRAGKQVFRVCQALGMEVKGYDKGMKYEYLKSLFQESDIISIHLSENKGTRGMINPFLLKEMKRTAMFINTSRASIVSNQYLYNMVKENRILGAALDVVDEERPPLNNYIVTPHIGGRSLEDRIATDNFMVSKLITHLYSSR